MRVEIRRQKSSQVVSTLLMPNQIAGYAVLYHHQLETDGLVRRQNGVEQNPFRGSKPLFRALRQNTSVSHKTWNEEWEATTVKTFKKEAFTYLSRKHYAK